ncbi:MAG: hypothetical protein B7Y40_04890 [Gammaproteobacteria bacterium 28-57-27]|nr:MAG: hypothetical protein B7Y40_04890 [Gammaproteobacteria bacterium 28-57-27]
MTTSAQLLSIGYLVEDYHAVRMLLLKAGDDSIAPEVAVWMARLNTELCELQASMVKSYTVQHDLDPDSDFIASVQNLSTRVCKTVDLTPDNVVQLFEKHNKVV